MKTHHHALLWGGAAVAVYLIWKYLHLNAGVPFGAATQGIALPAGGGSTNAAPYNGVTPGFGDNYQIYFGQQQPFNSVSNVNVNVSGFSSLTQKYIPLYGFVGMATQ